MSSQDNWEARVWAKLRLEFSGFCLSRFLFYQKSVYSNNFFIPKSKTFKDFPLSIDIRTISSGWLSPTDIASSSLHLFTDFCGVPTKICWAL